MKLFEINNQIENLLSIAIDEDGVLKEEFEGELDQLNVDKKDKCLNIAKLIKSWDSDIKGFSDAISSMQSRKKTLENKKERLKKYLKDFAEGENYEDSQIKVSWSKSSSVEIFGDVPESFKKLKYENDKTAIKEAIKHGAELSFARIVENKNLRIG